MVTKDDVLFLMQRGAVVVTGRETQEESERHTRTQIEAIVGRETAALRLRAEKAEVALRDIIDLGDDDRAYMIACKALAGKGDSEDGNVPRHN